MAALACVVWLLCGLYTSAFIYRGWVPHDEGTIGQSAERALLGEVPHRDFDDVYTGGLSYFHAAGMRLFGTNLRVPRLMLFSVFMAFLAAVYAIARRTASTGAGLVAMVLATVWSVPNYFVALPSWYNLFLATFGGVALLRYLENRHRRWLVLAGLCGGLSVLAKIAGLFYLAAAFAFLLFVEQTEASSSPMASRPGRRLWFVAAIPAVGVLLAATALMRSRAGVGDAIQLFIPALIVSLFLVWHERTTAGSDLQDRVRRVLAMTWPFVAGAVIPLAGFVIFFWSEHAISDLLRGLFVLPQRRLEEASLGPPAMGLLGLSIPYAALLIAEFRGPLKRESILALVVLAALSGVLFFGDRPGVYRAMWAMARAMPIVVTLAGAWWLDVNSPTQRSPKTRQHVFLLLGLSAFVSLVQFPYATPTYFCYAAPMTILALIALVSARPHAPLRIHLAVAMFFLVFAVVFVNRSYGWNLGIKFIRYEPESTLDLERGGLRVPAADKATYETLVASIRSHAANGDIFAGPDCPEVYFLSGKRNLTRSMFDFLSPAVEDEAWIESLITHNRIRVVVINTAPLFSPQLAAHVDAYLRRTFRSSVAIGRFVVLFND